MESSDVIELMYDGDSEYFKGYSLSHCFKIYEALAVSGLLEEEIIDESV